MYCNFKNLRDSCKETNNKLELGTEESARLRSHVHALAAKMGQRNPTSKLPTRLLSLDRRCLAVDYDLRELLPDRCHDLRVLRLSLERASASRAWAASSIG